MNMKKGFTLIELMIAVTIIAILAVTGYTTFAQSQLRGRDIKRKQDLVAIAAALETYYQQNRHYPCTGDNWQDSDGASGNWITDTAIVGTSCGVNGVTTLLDSRFLSLPIDPSNTGVQPWLNNPVNYSYAYFSGDYHGCRSGQGYWLITRLENPNDEDSYARKRIHPCNFPTYPDPSFTGAAYMISVY